MKPLSASMRRVSAALSQSNKLAHASPPRLHDSQQAPRINTYALLPIHEDLQERAVLLSSRQSQVGQQAEALWRIGKDAWVITSLL